LTEAIIVDDGIIKKRKIIEKIAEKNDSAVLMINQNLYTHRADFPNAILYNKWREINQQMILFFLERKDYGLYLLFIVEVEKNHRNLLDTDNEIIDEQSTILQ
tara:strand:- start:304 stop:612 length:309 start_codon:yes stop_codon:yes gene_type:complete